MKVAVITRHFITNYGSLLQAMATQKIINNLGYTCEIIDYVREDENYKNYEKTSLNRKKSWNSNLIKRSIYLLLRQPECFYSGRKFEKEQRKYLNLTRRYKNKYEIKTNKPIADIYMTGSDQVWGPVTDGSYDDTYCLSFTEENDKRIAYAASFGHVNFTPYLRKYFYNWLKTYNQISVREDSAVEIINKLGFRAKQVLDPTLLLDSSYWETLCKPIKQRKYILVYQIHNDKRLGRYAEKVAKAKKMPLLRVSVSFHQITREGKLIWCPNVGEFLSYLKNAECIITDSFHGTAFAINFNVPFVEILPNNNTGIRNTSILKLLGLTDRILHDEDNIELSNKIIDYEYVNNLLSSQREKSITILKRMLENKYEGK